MKLYMSGNSPYARRARLAIRELGLADQVAEVAIKSFDELLALGPGSKIPVLVTDSGRVLCESHIIIAHLSELAGADLLPAEPSERERCREIEAIASVLMDSVFARSFENNQRSEAVRSEAVLDKERARSTRCYDALTALVADEVNATVAGADSDADLAPATLATITTIAALGYADWRAAEDNWRAGRPELQAYFDRWMRRSSFAETAPVY